MSQSDEKELLLCAKIVGIFKVHIRHLRQQTCMSQQQLLFVTIRLFIGSYTTFKVTCLLQEVCSKIGEVVVSDYVGASLRTKELLEYRDEGCRTSRDVWVCQHLE